MPGTVPGILCTVPGVLGTVPGVPGTVPGETPTDQAASLASDVSSVPARSSDRSLEAKMGETSARPLALVSKVVKKDDAIARVAGPRVVPWLEQCAPTVWPDICGHRRLVAQLQALGASGTMSANLVLYGPPGTGKSLMAGLLLRQLYGPLFDKAVAIVHPGTHKNVEALRSRLTAFCKARQPALAEKPRVLWLEDAEDLVAVHQDLAAQCASRFKNVRLLVTCQTTERLRPCIVERCSVQRLPELPDEEVLALLVRVVRDRRPHWLDAQHLDPEALWWLASHAEGDARQALFALQRAMAGAEALTLPGAQAALDLELRQTMHALVGHCGSGNLASALRLLGALEKQGYATYDLLIELDRAVQGQSQLTEGVRGAFTLLIARAAAPTTEIESNRMQLTGLVARLCAHVLPVSKPLGIKR